MIANPVKKLHIAGSGAIGSLLAGAAEKHAFAYALYPRSAPCEPKLEGKAERNIERKPTTDSPHGYAADRLSDNLSDNLAGNGKHVPRYLKWIDGTTFPIQQIKATKPQLSQNDVLLLPLKVHHLEAALNEWLPLLSRTTPVVLLHNGMGGYEVAKKILPPNQPLLLATTSHGAMKGMAIEHDENRLSGNPTQVIYTGLGATQIGMAPHWMPADIPSTPEPKNAIMQNCSVASHASAPYQDTDKVRESRTKQQPMPEWANNVCHTLNTLLPPVSYQTDIMHALWAKLAINVVINPLTALHNVTNRYIAGEQFASERRTLCEEFTLVANACGQNFDASTVEQNVINVAKLTGNNYSSMHQDVINRRQTEIDAINGYIVSMAQKKGIEVPFNTLITEQIAALIE